MKFTETNLKGAYIIEIERIGDERGFFGRQWCQNEMTRMGLNAKIAQVNTSLNKEKGTLRGLHFQKFPYQETKLIRCIRGRIFDVIVDLRPDSVTFKKWFGLELAQDNYKMLYAPDNFAHGFITLEDNSEILYLVSQFYHPEAEAGLRWNDPQFSIEWPGQVKVISEKDKFRPDFDENQYLNTFLNK
ncbi:MAG TPA: dTDP-4-dehydrorhamnose 3,5-epimerase [Bacteroidales bacterium]